MLRIVDRGFRPGAGRGNPLPFLALLLSLGGIVALTACYKPEPRESIGVGVVGAPPRLGPLSPNTRTLSAAEAWLAGQTGMGLVRFDGRGQIIDGVAERWMVTADGLTMIFRIKPLRWADGRAVRADHLAGLLNAARAPASRNRLKPLLSAVVQISAMTDRVVEVRLRAPRPHMLELFAQPELGFWRHDLGLGPLALASRSSPEGRAKGDRGEGRQDSRLALPDGGHRLILTAAPHKVDPDAVSSGADQAQTYAVRFDTTARLMALYRAERLAVVTGGRWDDWPLVKAAAVPEEEVHQDPALGLFGLAATRAGRLADRPDLIAALSMSIDREALAQVLALPGWAVRESLMPAALDLDNLPRPSWSDQPAAARYTAAIRAFSAWPEASQPLRVALGDGHAAYGRRLLFTRLASDWGKLGLRLVAVADDDAPDLILVDELAPNQSANWFATRALCFARQACNVTAQSLVESARKAPDLAGRADQLTRAVALWEAAPTMVVFGAPVRWAVVKPRISGWQTNAFAFHPLNGVTRQTR